MPSSSYLTDSSKKESIVRRSYQVRAGKRVECPRSVASTLVKIYPAAPQNADAWLAEEIQRAACDPGALGVFRSVFYLPKPRPLNYLVAERFAGPALVLQV